MMTEFVVNFMILCVKLLLYTDVDGYIYSR